MSTKKKGNKRQRTDTFTHLSNDEICQRINSIINGTHETYVLDKEYVIILDAAEEKKSCWALFSKGKSSKKVENLWSAAAYRSFYVWWVYDQGKDTKENLGLVSKTGHHHAHRCPNGDYCCNPDHIRILDRTENEIDKHWHYFLKGDKREEFIKLYRDELIQRNIW